MTPPPAANTEQTITVPVTVKNQGQGNVSGFYVELYYSKDNVITRTDGYLERMPVQWGLAPGASVTLNFTVRVPASGDYYIGAIVDPTNEVEESIENNNTLAGSQMIAVTRLYPDLTITSVTPPPAANTAQTITVPVTVKNQGQVNATGFYVELYISNDSVITRTDGYLKSEYVGGLALGASVTLNFTVTVPVSGDYYIGAFVDSDNRVEESNENNNTLAGSQPTTVTGVN